MTDPCTISAGEKYRNNLEGVPLLIDHFFPTPELNFVEINEVGISKMNHSQNDLFRFTVLKEKKMVPLLKNFIWLGRICLTHIKFFT